jgi:hypothetical protein
VFELAVIIIPIALLPAAIAVAVFASWWLFEQHHLLGGLWMRLRELTKGELPAWSQMQWVAAGRSTGLLLCRVAPR